MRESVYVFSFCLNDDCYNFEKQATSSGNAKAIYALCILHLTVFSATAFSYFSFHCFIVDIKDVG